MPRRSSAVACLLCLLGGLTVGCRTNETQDSAPAARPAQTVNDTDAGTSQPPSLNEQLAARQQAWRAKADPETVATYQAGIDEIRRRGIPDQAASAGEFAPDFILPDATGLLVKSRELRQQGPLVLTFYRGGWCPYCNMQLRAYQEILPEIRALGGQLVAISPEMPSRAFTTKERGNLDFTVLSDTNSRVARDYGLAYRLPAPVAAQLSRHIDLEQYNGVGADELPVTATYVIDPSGKITYAFVDADYRKRAEPADILAALRELNASN